MRRASGEKAVDTGSADRFEVRRRIHGVRMNDQPLGVGHGIHPGFDQVHVALVTAVGQPARRAAADRTIGFGPIEPGGKLCLRFDLTARVPSRLRL